MDAKLLGEAEKIQHDYMGQAIGLTDAVNACLAWRLRQPTVLSFDNHYRRFAPGHPGERPLNVRP